LIFEATQGSALSIVPGFEECVAFLPQNPTSGYVFRKPHKSAKSNLAFFLLFQYSEKLFVAIYRDACHDLPSKTT
jgi:hypothetical protein